MTKTLIPTVVIALLMALPAYGLTDEDTLLFRSANYKNSYIDPELTKGVEMKPKKQKKPFSVRHPKIWTGYRKCRKAMVKLTPVVNFAGAVAQVVTAVKH
jgi:hypothetical protein